MSVNQEKIEKIEKIEFNHKEYNKKYYLANKNNKFECAICKGKYSTFTKAHHEKTKKHIKKIEENKEVKENNISFYDFKKMLISALLEFGYNEKKESAKE